MKKEYYLPLAIIIGTIIIGLSIYLGTTAEYRGKRAYCEKFIKEVNPKDSKKTHSTFYELQILGCINKLSEWESS